MPTVETLARADGADRVTDNVFPDDWGLWVEDGYLGGDRYRLRNEAIAFIANLTQLARCGVADSQSRSLISVEELRQGQLRA
jgi:hypothetical protein